MLRANKIEPPFDQKIVSVARNMLTEQVFIYLSPDLLYGTALSLVVPEIRFEVVQLPKISEDVVEIVNAGGRMVRRRRHSLTVDPVKYLRVTAELGLTSVRNMIVIDAEQAGPDNPDVYRVVGFAKGVCAAKLTAVMLMFASDGTAIVSNTVKGVRAKCRKYDSEVRRDWSQLRLNGLQGRSDEYFDHSKLVVTNVSVLQEDFLIQGYCDIRVKSTTVLGEPIEIVHKRPVSIRIDKKLDRPVSGRLVYF